jgi:hypothetical protein
MASESTPGLDLFKPIPSTNEPFRVTDINDNWDKIDLFAATYQPRIIALETMIEGGTP